jgi:hypothetical protein
MQKIYEDQFVVVYYKPSNVPHSGNFILVTFSPLNFEWQGQSFWGAGLGSKLDVDCIGFVAKGKNWYPYDSMLRAAAATEIYTSDKKQDIIVYGTSMGGYGALKYSGLLKANYVISISPQASIDPAAVSDFDKRFIVHFNPLINMGMTIGSGDVSGRVHLFYDPY